MTDFPSTVGKVLGDELDIDCVATGKPKPTSIQWYFNGTLIDSSSNDRTTITNTLGANDDLTISSTLNIQSLDESNQGVYTCTASNIIPSGSVTDSSSFSLFCK